MVAKGCQFNIPYGLIGTPWKVLVECSLLIPWGWLVVFIPGSRWLPRILGDPDRPHLPVVTANTASSQGPSQTESFYRLRQAFGWKGGVFLGGNRKRDARKTGGGENVVVSPNDGHPCGQPFFLVDIYHRSVNFNEKFPSGFLCRQIWKNIPHMGFCRFGFRKGWF